jgi:hypothetical protein
MIMKDFLKLATIFLILTSSINNSLQEPILNTLDVFKDGSYLFTWTINEIEATIKVELDVQCTGWIGIGLSQDGQMSNSDVIMCYYSNNQAKALCRDSWANSRSTPPADDSLGGVDNLTDVTGSVTNGRTKISFKRNLDTGDSKDLVIFQGKKMNVIFSYRENGNPDTENGQFLQHTRNSSNQIELYSSNKPLISPKIEDSNSYSIKLTFENYQVPSDRTTYSCKYYDLNNLLQQQTQKANNITYHAIKFDPIIDNQDLVHHMVLYGCNFKDIQISQDNFECVSMPANCKIFTWAWAPGLGTFNLPEEAGIIWGTYDTLAIVLQIHYNNLNLVSGIKDNSGVDVIYTTNLRTYDSGLMSIGLFQDYLVIPAGQSAYEVTGLCEPNCTNNLKGDINIFAYMFHGHHLLKKMITSFKKADGSIDFTWVENNYSFDHQRIYMLEKPVKVSKGFTATTVCTYNSQDKSTVTRGGEGSQDEMCYNFVQYYPRENGIQTCFTSQGLGYCPLYDKIERVLSGFKNSLNSMLLILLFILF